MEALEMLIVDARVRISTLPCVSNTASVTAVGGRFAHILDKGPTAPLALSHGDDFIDTTDKNVVRSASAMKLIDLIVTLCHFLSVIGAVPVDTADGCTTRRCYENNLKTRAGTKCDLSSKYTVEWFIEHATDRPEPMSCLFYTRGLSRAARRYAKSRPSDEGPPLTTIWVFVYLLYA
jgi:hypothetical protein